MRFPFQRMMKRAAIRKQKGLFRKKKTTTNIPLFSFSHSENWAAPFNWFHMCGCKVVRLEGYTYLNGEWASHSNNDSARCRGISWVFELQTWPKFWKAFFKLGEPKASKKTLKKATNTSKSCQITGFLFGDWDYVPETCHLWQKKCPKKRDDETAGCEVWWLWGSELGTSKQHKSTSRCFVVEVWRGKDSQKFYQFAIRRVALVTETHVFFLIWCSNTTHWPGAFLSEMRSFINLRDFFLRVRN